MGILNVTPDSFSDGGRFLKPDVASLHLQRMLSEGASFIDVGGESSRPGAKPVPAEEEKRRIEPVLAAWVRDPKGFLSVDTRKASVAETAFQYGVSLVNDITALKGDVRMADVIAERGAGVVLMHMQGTPETMQENPRYGDPVGEVLSFLERAIRRAVDAGIREESILVDPGIGFGKTLEQNLMLLRQISRFHSLGRPVVLGTSRKSFIGEILNRPVDGSTPLRIEERLWGTAATVAYAVTQGVQVLRVHDIEAMRHVVQVTEAIVAS